jgi:MtN3 and saliva related transmembrane protein
MDPEYIGWASSLVLLATILKQVHKQWREASSEGVSRWLFAGQIAASSGFVVYSWLVGNPVFVATNALLVLSAIAGQVIVVRNRRCAQAQRTVPS